MPAKAPARRTPSDIVGRILHAAMAAGGISADDIAKLASVHKNTVLSDLREPDKMPLHRMWLYFLALGVPIDEALQAFADAFARGLTERR